jgi:NADH:ubiquinone oxidoreductase subunit 6 (subunit J)
MKPTSPMLAISFWASKNVIQARILLAISHLLLTALAIAMGMLLKNETISIDPIFGYTSILLFLIAFAAYPYKNKSVRFTKRYGYQKIFDGLLALSTFLMLICFSNQSWNHTNAANAWMPKRISSVNTHSNETSITSPEAKIIPKKEEKKQWLNKVMNFLNASKSYTSGEKVIFTILAILGAAALLYLVAALACNISCNGAEGAAIVVAVVGVGAIIFLFIKLMKHLNKNPSISRNKSRNKKPSSTMGE